MSTEKIIPECKKLIDYFIIHNSSPYEIKPFFESLLLYKNFLFHGLIRKI